MTKHSLDPGAINHYLKPFRSTVFFFNLSPSPHQLMAQITEELTKSIVFLPAHLAYLVLFWTLWLFGRRRE